MADLSCRDFIEFLDDYVEGTQPDGVRAKFERHLEMCPQCIDYLKTYRDTIDLVRGACADDGSLAPPDDAPEELIQMILQSRPTN